MKHDPLRDRDYTVLRLAKGSQLRFYGIVTVGHVAGMYVASVVVGVLRCRAHRRSQSAIQGGAYIEGQL